MPRNLRIDLPLLPWEKGKILNNPIHISNTLKTE